MTCIKHLIKELPSFVNYTKARVLANYYYWNKLNKKIGIEAIIPLNLNQEDIDFITKGDMRWQNF